MPVRCAWAPTNDPEYLTYHDGEWGVPVHDEARLFEMLSLEGAQAGLSWSTILHKREGYRRAFASFDHAPTLVNMSSDGGLVAFREWPDDPPRSGDFRVRLGVLDLIHDSVRYLAEPTAQLAKLREDLATVKKQTPNVMVMQQMEKPRGLRLSGFFLR